MLNLSQLFKDHDDEWGEFERIKNPPSLRPDLVAFILLDKLCQPNSATIIASSIEDRIYITTRCSELAEKATIEDVITLIRCGICYSDEHDSLYIIV